MKGLNVEDGLDWSELKASLMCWLSLNFYYIHNIIYLFILSLTLFATINSNVSDVLKTTTVWFREEPCVQQFGWNAPLNT